MVFVLSRRPAEPSGIKGTIIITNHKTVISTHGSPPERGNHRPTQCRRRRPVIRRAPTQARATFGRSGFMRISGAKRVRNPSGIGRGRPRHEPGGNCQRPQKTFCFKRLQKASNGFKVLQIEIANRRWPRAKGQSGKRESEKRETGRAVVRLGPARCDGGLTGVVAGWPATAVEDGDPGAVCRLCANPRRNRNSTVWWQPDPLRVSHPRSVARGRTPADTGTAGRQDDGRRRFRRTAAFCFAPPGRGDVLIITGSFQRKFQ